MTTELRSSACFVALQSVGNAALVDEWVHLIPSGTFKGEDGRGPYTVKDPEELVRLSMTAAPKLYVDECHSTDLAAPKGLAAPARGWIVELQARDDGVWGRVEWTPTGKQLRSEMAYRGISPVIHVRKGTSPADIAMISGASLTNAPNFPLHQLHQKGLDEMSLSPETLKRLGLAADADQKAIETAIGKISDQAETHSKAIAAVAKAAGKEGATGDELVTHLQAQGATLAAIAKAAGKDGATGDDLVKHLQARAAAGDPAKLAETVVELQGRLDTLTGATAKKDATAFVDAQIAAGKPIKALRDHYIERHQKDAPGVEKELQAMASVHDGRLPPPKDEKLATAAGATDANEIVRKAQLHQKEHGGDWTSAVLAVSGR